MRAVDYTRSALASQQCRSTRAVVLDRDATMVSGDPSLRYTVSDRASASQALTADNCPKLEELEGCFQEAVRAELDYDCQTELANLVVCLTKIKSEGRDDLLPHVELALSAISNSSRNIVFAQHIMWHIESSLGTSTAVRPIRWLRNNSPPANVMLGLLCHFALSALLALLILAMTNMYLELSRAYLEWSGAAIIPEGVYQPAPRSSLAGWLTSPVASTLLIVVLSAISGSIISIMARINAFTTAITVRPLVLFLTGLLKPVIGIGSAVFIYAVLNTGFIPLEIPADKTIAAWAAIAFVAGFSERLAPDVVGKLAGMRGGSDSSGQHSEASIRHPA
jgi:hypothetical protein